MEPIVPFDAARMFLGDEPPLFYVEIVVRVLVVWLWTMVLLRWIGGRSISQLSLVEFLLVIALGSAVGDAMFYADVPILHALQVVLLVVLMDKLVDQLIRRFRTAKRVIDGNPVVLLRDGTILWDAIGARRVGPGELMERLRLKGVENLGNVRAAFLEPSGQISIFGALTPRPGLAIVPPLELADPGPYAGRGIACCGICGWVADGPPPDVCPNCHQVKWSRAACSPLGTDADPQGQ